MARIWFFLRFEPDSARGTDRGRAVRPWPAAHAYEPHRTIYWASSADQNIHTNRYHKVCIWCAKRRALATASTSIHSMQAQRVVFASPSAHAPVPPLSTSRSRTDARNTMKSHADCCCSSHVRRVRRYIKDWASCDEIIRRARRQRYAATYSTYSSRRTQ